MSVVRSKVWHGTKEAGTDFPLDDLDGHLADPDALVWLDLSAPTPDLLDTLAAELNLEATSVEDAVTPGERPKATRHLSHAFVTVYDTFMSDYDGETRLETSRISVFVMPRGLITVHADPDFNIDDVIQHWEANSDLLVHGPAALLHGLLDTVVDNHFATIQAMDSEMEALEDVLFAGNRQPQEVQQRVYRLRKDLVALRRVVLPMREVLSSIMRYRIDSGAEEKRALDAWFDDLYDHVLRASEWTESLRDMISTIFETNLSLQDAHMNEVMKKLAGWGAIIAVPTLITGWFGQNIPFVGNGTPLGLWLSVALVVAATGSLFVAFKKYGWI